MPKILLTITGTWSESHSVNWMECATTWVPLIKKQGIDVLFLMSNPHLDREYEIKGNFFFAKCPDTVKKIYWKNHYYISKYFLEETDYDYRFHTDSDTFIHPERFKQLLEDFTINNPKDYMGCVLPYPGFNVNDNRSEEIKGEGFYASGGSGFLLSRKSHKYLVEDFNEEEYEHLGFCDKITGEILYNRGIKLWHDSRLLFESPWNRTIADPHNLGSPFIGDKDSFLAVQHYCNGYMYELKQKLSL